MIIDPMKDPLRLSRPSERDPSEIKTRFIGKPTSDLDDSRTAAEIMADPQNLFQKLQARMMRSAVERGENPEDYFKPGSLRLGEKLSDFFTPESKKPLTSAQFKDAIRFGTGDTKNFVGPSKFAKIPLERTFKEPLNKEGLTKEQVTQRNEEAARKASIKNKEGLTQEQVAQRSREAAKKAAEKKKEGASGDNVGLQAKDTSEDGQKGGLSDSDLPKKDAKNLTEQYAEEIASLMPKFEGKSEFEKGIDLMRLGMAISAGDSPNAIQNISKGFLAMGDTFSEDAKQKRQFERQVKLSTSQAVLDRLNADRQNQFELNKLDSEADRASKIAANDRIKEIIGQLNANGMLEMDKIQPQLDVYVKSLEDVADAENAKLGLQFAARNIFVDKSVQGVNNFLKDKFNKALNAIGITDKRVMKSFRTGKKELTVSQLERLEAKLAPILLGESGKTISDRDRDLVKRLMGNFTDLEAIYKDPESIKRAFEDIERMLNETIVRGNNSADAFEKNYGNYFIQGPDTEIDFDTGLVTGGKRVSQLDQVLKRGRDRKKQGNILSISDIGSFEGTGKDMKFVLRDQNDRN